MRNKTVPEKKSWLGSGFGSGKKLVAAALNVVAKSSAKKDKQTPEKTAEPAASESVEDPAETVVEKKKSRRFRPGTVAIREIKKAQSNKGLNGASRSRLDRIIRDIASDVVTSSGSGKEGIRFQPSALEALRESAEFFETDLLRLGNTLSIHRGKLTLHKRDLDLASSLMLAPHVLQEEQGSRRLLSGALKIMRRAGSKSLRNERKAIVGRDTAKTSRGLELRRFTQEAMYNVVPDPPGQDAEEQIGREIDEDADPETEMMSDAESEDESEDEMQDAEEPGATIEEVA